MIIGNSIIPDLVNGIIEWMGNLFTSWIDAVKNGIAAIVTFFQELPGKLAEFGSKVWSWIVDAWNAYWAFQQERFTTLVNFVREIPGKLKAGASAIWTWIKDAWNAYWAGQQQQFSALIDFVKSIPAKLKAGASAIWTWIKDAWNAYWAEQKRRFDNLVTEIKNLPTKLANAARGMWDWLKNTFKDALNWVIDRWNNFQLRVRVPDNFITRGLGLAGLGFDIDTPNIPRLAMGGVVYPQSGGTLAMIAEAGRAERVEPLDSSGLSKRDRAMIQMLSGGGSTINVYPSPGMDERELADMVSRRLAYQMRRGAV
jgi:phage-related protein